MQNSKINHRILTMKYLKLLGLVLTVFLNANPLAAQDVNDDYFTVVYNDSTINLPTKTSKGKLISKYKQNGEKERAVMWVNGMCDTIVKDQDRINLSLPQNYNTIMIDSVKWYAHFECTDNQEYTYCISDQLSPIFVCQPQMFNCYFSRSYPHYLKGFDWKRLKEVYPFGSYFSCYIYTTNNGKPSVASLRTEDITYDVLPQTPVLTVEKVWTPIEGDDDYPVAQIHVDSGNFDEGLILVEQSRDQLPVYVDTLFTTISNDGFVVSLGTWNNGILCWVRNQYGQAVSEILRFDSSDIQNNILASDLLTLDARQLVVKPHDEARLWVFDATGRLESNICTDKKVCIPLKPGIHLIKWLDTKSNMINKYKIYIK